MRERWAITFVVAAMSVAGCGQSITGRACSASAPCPTRYACVPAHDRTMRCMLECPIMGPMAETVCADGTVCLPLTTGTQGACYLGGNIGLGQMCSSDLDCTRTALCLHTGPVAQCYVGCNIDGTHPCHGGFACQPTTGSAGFCANR